MAGPLTPQRLHMAWCVGGILGSLLLYGVLQVSSAEMQACPSSCKDSALTMACVHSDTYLMTAVWD